MPTLTRIIRGKIPSEHAAAALQREAYRLIASFADSDPEDRAGHESLYRSAYNDLNLKEPVSRDLLERILNDARNNPYSAPAVQLATPEIIQFIDQPGVRKALQELSSKYVKTEEVEKGWRDHFKTVGQLADGDVRMLLEDFLPEGINFLGALSGHGKTLFALSMVKSFTTGARFLGKYKPEKIFPVLYLIPESSGRAFKMRCKAFGIPDDPNRFLCRTISDGVTLLLDDPIVLKAVQEMKPIVFLDTMIRFSESKDKNSSAENQAVAKNVLALRAAGAVSVIGLHHATKAFAEGEITLEACLRGTGDIAALCDSVYALRRDRTVFDNGNGPEELDIVCVKDRDIKNPPKLFRIAARYIKDDGTRASFIDETGDFHLIESSAVLQDLESKFVKMVAETDPTINREDLAGELGITQHALRKLAKRLGWSRPATTHGVWAIDAGPVKPGVAFKKKKPEVQAEPERSGLCGVDPGPPLELS